MQKNPGNETWDQGKGVEYLEKCQEVKEPEKDTVVTEGSIPVGTVRTMGKRESGIYGDEEEEGCGELEEWDGYRQLL